MVFVSASYQIVSYRFEKNFTDTVISHVGRHITCDVKGNCCLAFSSVGKREGLKLYTMKVKIIKCSGAKYWYRDYVGKIFTVFEVDKIKRTYLVHKGRLLNSFIDFDDCEILN